MYFTLQASEELSGVYGEHCEIKLSLDEIADCDISFTFGDSMALYYCETLNQVFTKNELLKQLKLYNNDVNKFLEDMKERCVFVEAHLWNNKYLQGSKKG